MIEWNWVRWCDGDWCWYLKDDVWVEGRLAIRMEYGEFYDANLTETNGKLIRSMQFLDIFNELKGHKPNPQYDTEEAERLYNIKEIR